MLSRAEPLPGPTEARYAALARPLGIWLVVPGTVYEREGDAVYTTASAIDPQGRVAARHRKLYPFVPYETGLTPGTRATVFDVPGVGRVGLSICYEQVVPGSRARSHGKAPRSSCIPRQRAPSIAPRSSCSRRPTRSPTSAGSST